MYVFSALETKLFNSPRSNSTEQFVSAIHVTVTSCGVQWNKWIIMIICLVIVDKFKFL